MLAFTSPHAGLPGYSCDTVYSAATTQAAYRGGNQKLLAYIDHELGPLLYGYMQKEEVIISKLHILFTIDHMGKVIEVSFPKTPLSIACKEALRQKLLTMDGWTPAQIRDQNVCSTYLLPISCLKWQ